MELLTLQHTAQMAVDALDYRVLRIAGMMGVNAICQLPTVVGREFGVRIHTDDQGRHIQSGVSRVQ